jgi:hypothetical protein
MWIGSLKKRREAAYAHQSSSRSLVVAFVAARLSQRLTQA